MSDPATLRDRLARAIASESDQYLLVPLTVAVRVAAEFVEAAIADARRAERAAITGELHVDEPNDQAVDLDEDQANERARAQLTEQLHIDDPYDPYGTRRTP